MSQTAKASLPRKFIALGNHIGQHSSAVDSVAISQRQGSIPSLGQELPAQILDVLPMSEWPPSGGSSFLQHSKGLLGHSQVRFTDGTLPVDVCVCGCCSFQPSDELLTCHVPCPKLAGVG